MMQNTEVSDAELLNIKSSNQTIFDIADAFIEMLLDSLKGSAFIVTILDHNGIVIKSHDYAVYNERDDRSACRLFLPGTQFTEDKFGITAIGLAIKNKKPCQVARTEHSNKRLHSWTCFAAPILDQNRNLLGVIGLSCESELADRYLPALITSTAKAIENEIKVQRINRTLSENNNQMETTLSAVSDGVVYVTSDKIIQINKTMSEFLGKPAKEIIGKEICDCIITFPSIEESVKRADSDNHVEVMITGAEKNYNCLLNIRYVDDSENSFVMIFTRTEEIQMLARKINKHNAFFTFEDIKGNSFGIKEAITLAKKASEYNFTIIIEGESGTGKEMLAQAIHNNSSRKHKPFITFDCGAIPHQLFEGELFGYAKTDILLSGHAEQPGKFELANGGTIFLDDITNMPMEVQAKMLRILQEDKVLRIGGMEKIPLDVRIIAASNLNLEREVRNGNFRSDLFYRLNVVFIKLPALRERKEDIAVLADHFLNKERTGGNYSIDKKAMSILELYHWPGNVRELHNAVERAAMVSDGNIIKKENFAINIMDHSDIDSAPAELLTMDEQIKTHLIRVLDYTGGNISEAARILDISRVTIYKILNRSV